MTLKITFDVVWEGKQAKGDLEWKGTRGEMLDEARFMEKVAAASGLTPQQFVTQALSTLPWLGMREDERERTFQMRFLAYAAILFAGEQGTSPLVYPIIELLDERDVSAHLTMRDNEIKVEIGGASRTLN